MKHDELLKRIQTSDPDREFLLEIEEKLKTETARPSAEQNIDLIDELTDAALTLTGAEQSADIRAAAGMEKLLRQMHLEKRKRRNAVIRWSVAACAALLVAANIYSYRVYGINAFSAAYQFCDNLFAITPENPPEIVEADCNAYEADMRRLLAEQSIEAMVPSYIPTVYQPTDAYGLTQENRSGRMIDFHFSRPAGNQTIELDIQYIKLNDPNQATVTDLSTDFTANATERVIDGITVQTVQDHGNFTAQFAVGDLMCIVRTQGEDDQVSQKILESMFP